jgi:hypothetical protein
MFLFQNIINCKYLKKIFYSRKFYKKFLNVKLYKKLKFLLALVVKLIIKLQHLFTILKLSPNLN